MYKRALYSLIPLVLLAGCPERRDSTEAKPSGTAGTASHGSERKCHRPEDCKVTVTVTACSAAGITADPNILKVARRLRDVDIVWTLRAPEGYTFHPRDGINFKEKDLAARQFTFTEARSNPHEVVWRDANTVYKEYPYNIKVRFRGQDCPQKDPIVVNDGTDG